MKLLGGAANIDSCRVAHEDAGDWFMRCGRKGAWWLVKPSRSPFFRRATALDAANMLFLRFSRIESDGPIVYHFSQQQEVLGEAVDAEQS